jgi:hypothetical protein
MRIRAWQLRVTSDMVISKGDIRLNPNSGRSATALGRPLNVKCLSGELLNHMNQL